MTLIAVVALLILGVNGTLVNWFVVGELLAQREARRMREDEREFIARVQEVEREEKAWEATGGVSDPEPVADPTDGIIPDHYDPTYRGTISQGYWEDGQVDTVDVPADPEFPDPNLPTIMPDGTVVLGGRVISRHDFSKQTPNQ